MPSRFRADLVELAWARERKFGMPPGAGEAIGSSTNGDEGGFGLLNAGIDLPDPRIEWEPFYGVGVVDRNFNFPVQGREVLEGSIPTSYLTHDNSRLFLEQIMGLIYNSNSLASRVGAVTTTTTILTDASATFETGTYKNNTWTSGTANLAVLVETNGGGVGGASDETTAHDDNSGTNLAISFNDATDRLYIGAATPFTHIRIDIGATPNAVAAVLAAEFSDGDGNFVDGAVVSDGTSSGGVSFAQDGIIVLSPPANWGRDPYGSDADNFYWVRLNFGSATITASTEILDTDLYTSHPTHIIIIHEAGAGGTVDQWKDTFAFIGPAKGSTVGGGDTDSDGETVINVFADWGLTIPGWHGKAPLTAESGGNTNYNIYRIERVTGGGVLPNVTGGNTTANIRETLVQPSFTLSARFTAEDGGRFTTNYTGNKIARATFNFEEGRPVTFTADFLTQDMKHNLGSNTTVLKYSDDVVNPTFRRINEQPYFFSRADLRFNGVDFARFRRLSLTVDNQLDPRYYLTQGQTIDNRQILFEILEGRRQITGTGTVDLDDNVADAQFLRYLLNQAFTDTDVRDMSVLQGVTIVIELERLIDGSGPSFDRLSFSMPSGTLGTNNVGLILRSARHPIPAPPQIHHEINLDFLTSSLQIEVADSVS